jgi:arylsulfatase A-like enzyme
VIKKNYQLKTIFTCLSVAPVLTGFGSTPDRPNIVCIVTEDISPYLGCYGDPVAKTPNLDNFAKEAIRYTNMHTTIGVSSPSRFALITGMYPSAMGANNMRTSAKNYEAVPPVGVKAYTEYMRAAGYYCTNGSKTDYQFNANPAQWDENNSTTNWKNCPEGQPFFSIINFMTTHESQIWSRKDSLEVLPEDIDMSKFPYYPDEPVFRQDLARLYTNIAIMDRQTQEVIDQLEADGLLDNTIIIWYSDNGGPIPRGKRSIYNTGTNVPFMVRYPDGYRAGEVEDRLCMFIDIPATILSLAGIEPPEYMHGQPFLGQYDTPRREYIFMARDRFDEEEGEKSAGVRDMRFQYLRNYTDKPNYMDIDYRLSMPMMIRLKEMHENGELNREQDLWFSLPRPKEEFYDVLNDPYQLNNLIDDPDYKFDIARLKAQYDEWNSTINKIWENTTEDELIEQFKPGGVQPVVANPTGKKSDAGWEISCVTPGSSIVYVINYVEPKQQNNQRNQAAQGTPQQGANMMMFGGGQRQPAIPWKLYTGPIELQRGESLMVMGCRAGYSSSEQIKIVK